MVEQRNQISKHPERSFFWLSILFDALLFMVTAVYAVFAYNQWQTMKAQTVAIQGQLNMMRSQLGVMEDQAKSMRDTLRPYVGIRVKDATLSFPNIEVALELSNAGNSPANEVRLKSGFVVDDHYKIPDDCGGSETPPVTIQPHENIPLLDRARVNVSLDRITHRDQFLFYCGKGSFMSGGVTYPVQFCYEYLPKYDSFSACPDPN